MRELVVVSGGSKGIGKAIVQKFGKEKFDLAICARDIEQLNEIKIEFEKSFSGHCFIFRADVSNKVEVEQFGDFVLGLNQPIAALINNAGVFLPGLISTEADGQLEIQMNTNLYSAYYLTRKLLQKLIENTQSHIFNICSIASLLAYPQSGSYTISKFALLGLSKSLRLELMQTNVKVTSVMPGATFTDSWAGIDLPENRFIQADDVAETIWSAFNLSASAVVEEIVLRPIKGDI